MSASVKPIVKTIINKNKTNFGALEVTAKILLGSKYLNIFKLYILKKGNLILTGAYGFPVPINEKKLIEVTSSAFGNVQANFI